MMNRRIWLILVLAVGLWGKPTVAQGSLGGLVGNLGPALTNAVSGQQEGVIVRTTLGLSGLQNVCLQEGCTVVSNLDGGLGQVFLVRPTQQGLLANDLASVLQVVDGIVDAEVDQVVSVPPNPTNDTLATSPPGGLWDTTTDSYYGSNAWDGYVNQPAVQIINLEKAQDTFKVGGAGIVADIDTGVDPNHPVLSGVLLQGYDFTRNLPGGSELRDISGTPPPCTSCVAAYVNQHTVAMVDQHTAAMVDGTAYAAFGHGTMVAGVIHLTAPTAQILPLKSFQADGTGNLSDILRAIYYAVQNNANVINMSFDLTQNSTELGDAINYALSSNVICVASSGNDGKMEVVYPAALQGVMGVASTSNQDQRSSFSNYGNQVVWVAAPGEGIVTTYPFGNYAAGWGTSFSSPFVAGTAALILDMQPKVNPSQVAWAISHAKWIGANMGYGRIDVYNTLWSLSPIQGTVGLLQ